VFTHLLRNIDLPGAEDTSRRLEFLASARRNELGRGAMNKVTRELVVRGSAAAAGLVVLVSVVGAGVKWGN